MYICVFMFHKTTASFMLCFFLFPTHKVQINEVSVWFVFLFFCLFLIDMFVFIHDYKNVTL